MRRGLIGLIFAALLLSSLGFAQDKLKVGFIYVGPVGDAGWTYGHDLGRQKLIEATGVETIIIESVAEADVESFIDQLVADGANVIFTTSFGYGDGTLAAADRYPDVFFGHATGIERAPNVMTYIAELYQAYYINGLIAGSLTKSNKIGYIAAFPIPEVKRHINAFALGIKEANPDAEVEVRWLFNWFDPSGAKEATEALIDEGADVFAFTEDTPTVIQTAGEKGLPSFSHYASMLDFSPDTVVSGQLAHWEAIYIDFIKGIQSGKYTTENLEDLDYFWRMGDKAAEAGAKPGMVVNPAYIDALKENWINDPELGLINAYDLILKRIEQMSDLNPEFEPFTGPIKDCAGNEIYAAGQKATIGEMMGIQWAAENINGAWSGGPGYDSCQ